MYASAVSELICEQMSDYYAAIVLYVCVFSFCMMVMDSTVYTATGFLGVGSVFI